jgi:hypothetical protein
MPARHLGCTILALAVIAARLHGADYDISYLYSTPTQQDPGNEIDEQEVSAKATYKVRSLAEAGYDLSLGIEAQVNTWNFDERQLEDIELYKLMVPVSAGRMFGQALYVNCTLSYGLHSDLEEMDSDDFRLQGALIGTFIHSPTLQFIFGVAYSDDFGEPQAFPIGGVAWQATEALKLDLILPSLAATYAVDEDLHLLGSFAPSGGQWRWSVPTAGERVDIDAALSGYRGGIGADWQVVPKGWVRLLTGMEIGREIKLSAADDPSVESTLDLTDSVFAQVGFRYEY